MKSQILMYQYVSFYTPDVHPQGESPAEWRTTDFRMFRGGSLWRPPVINSYSQRGEERGEEVEEDASPEEEVKKGQLRSE